MYPKGSVVKKKRQMISFDLKDYFSIVKDLERFYKMIEEKAFKEQSNIRKNKGVARTWYEHAATEKIQSLIIREHNIPKESFIRYVVFHFIDELKHGEKLMIAKRIFYQPESQLHRCHIQRVF